MSYSSPGMVEFQAMGLNVFLILSFIHLTLIRPEILSATLPLIIEADFLGHFIMQSRLNLCTMRIHIFMAHIFSMKKNECHDRSKFRLLIEA